MKIEETPLVNPRFRATKKELMDLAQKGRERDEFCEELEYVQELGGISFLTEKFGVDFTRGISNSEVEDRKAQYGSNEKKAIPPKSFLSLVWEALEDFTLRILCVAAVVSIAANVATASPSDRSHAWIDGFAIIVAVAIAVLVGAVNNYKRDQEFRRLNDISDDRKLFSIYRDGELKEIHQSKIVPGDVIKIFEGMDIPADGFVIEAHELTSDESAMTGETDPIKKANLAECLARRDEIIAEGNKNSAGKHEVPSPIILAGTKILTGDGKFIAIVVGESSSIGIIKALIQTDSEATPLQQKLEKIAGDIGKFGTVAAAFTLAILIIRFLVIRGQTNTWNKSEEYVEFVNFFIIAVTVIVVAIPEGLPLAVTLSLAFSVKKMLQDMNMVRRMEACETMGGANMICSDKTGTLTQNKMTVTTIWNEESIKVATEKPTYNMAEYIKDPHAADLIIQGFACNTSATLDPLKGSKTDIAMLEFLDRCDKKLIGNAKHQYLPTPDYIKFPFTSARKRQTTIITLPNGQKRLHIKGASEFVLECCHQWHCFSNNLVSSITPQMRVNLEQIIEGMADKSLRTICLAYKDLDGSENFKTHDEHGVYDIEKQGLTMIALIGIMDILRPEVKQAVQDCKVAGIKVRMVTGDNRITARAIARECGLLDENSIVMEGKEFQQLTGGVVCAKCLTKECDCPRNELEASKTKKEVRVDTIAKKKEFDEIIDKLAVMARSRPEDKYALVTGLMERGNVVAVTGDGTNDAPALKKANVGFAMGIAGTEVAREAAAIILLDDNFNSIVKAVLWGRNIYDSIRKFLQFQLTVNVAAVTCVMVGAALLTDQVFTPVQMLWINLIMDTLASLALATEPPTRKLLYRKPQSKDEYIVSKRMSKHIFGQAVYQMTIIFIIVFAGDYFIPEFLNVAPDDIPKAYSPGGYVRSGRLYYVNGDVDYKDYFSSFGPSRHYTMVFNTFVMMTIFNFFNARKLNDEVNIFEGITKSPLFLLIVLIIFSGQLIVGNVGGIPFRVSRNAMDPRQWLIAIAFGSGSWITSVILKVLIPSQPFMEAGKEMRDPLQNPSKILGLRRTSNQEHFERKLTNPALRNNSKQPSLGKVHYHNVAQ